jgi:hypothetical protein
VIVEDEEEDKQSSQNFIRHKGRLVSEIAGPRSPAKLDGSMREDFDGFENDEEEDGLIQLMDRKLSPDNYTPTTSQLGSALKD